jgi:hypothetical protein
MSQERGRNACASTQYDLGFGRSLARLADEHAVNIRFVLLGDGNQRRLLQQLANGVQRIEFKDRLQAEDYRQVLACADVLLVNERPGAGEMATPSKVDFLLLCRPPGPGCNSRQTA